MKNQIEKVFVKVNQVWLKGEAISKDEKTFKVRVPDYPDFEIDKQSPYLESLKFAAQRFAVGETKERLEGAYISFDKLPENVQDSLIKGESYLHSSSYIKDGALKESTKMVQMLYQQNSGSKLDVQIKRSTPVTLGEAKAYNHKFTADEFNQMVKENKVISFTGKSSNGETFTKLAFYEPKLNDIRTKAALSENTYFYGQKLTKAQAASMNQGHETEITIATKKGDKTYLVSYSPRAERFITKSVEPSKMNAIAVTSQEVKASVKKKASGQAVKI